MPELPEVETVCRGLRARLIGRRIVSVEVRSKDVIHQADMDASGFAEALCGWSIAEIARRGKYILIRLIRDEKTRWLVCHLRMTGKLLVRPEGSLTGKHTHVIFALDDGQWLFYDDVRRFGGFICCDSDPCLVPPLVALGPEPLSEAFSPVSFYEHCRRRKRPVKSHLLDQSVVAGIGNIYADEILFRAGVRPRKSAARLTRAECAAIVSATKTVLEEAIDAGGSTIRDYVDSEMRQGSYQFAHQVYGRAGKPCRRCGTILKNVTVGGRSSVYCPKCQKS